MLLEGKTAIVTGATRGIGKEIVRRFVQEGAFVIGVYSSSDEAAEKLKSELNTESEKVKLFKGSVSNYSFVDSLVNATVKKHGKIDILVNNAGINRDQFLFKMKEKDWDDVLSTNFSGTFYFCKAVLPIMEEQKCGKIINMVSVTGVAGREAQTNYGTSKGAIMGLTRLLARKYCGKGIGINALAPGMIETEMINNVPKEKLANFLHFTNAKKLGTTEQVASSVVYLSSNLSDYVTDTVLKVDGGFLR